MNLNFGIILKRVIQVILVILFFIGIVAALLWILNSDFISQQIPSTDSNILLNIIAIAATLTALISIFVSLEKSRKGRRDQLEQTTINLFKELRNQAFNPVTDNAWELRNRWGTWNKHEKAKCVISVFNEAPYKYLGIEERHIAAMYDLIGFYTVVSSYRGNDDFIRRLNYFYYGWWRDFLYEFSEMFDRKRSNGLYNFQDFRNKKFRKKYIKNISLKSALIRLDKLCGFRKIPGNLKIHRKGS